ncbi:MAG: hypothetical protein HC888_02275 [Candidatus Competibacteraceae bacterium]|nr:hypothetical protein [Candidatus Competibacteraceae bacterium]
MEPRDYPEPTTTNYEPEDNRMAPAATTTFYIELLPSYLRDKVAHYLLGAQFVNERRDKIRKKYRVSYCSERVTSTPIKTMVVAEWLSKGYMQWQSSEARKKRQITLELIRTD